MNKEELHKAALDWFISYCEYDFDDFVDVGPWSEYGGIKRNSPFYDVLVAFHLHQTKKMLEGWTDERIEELYDSEYYDKGPRSIMQAFRDELLKSLGYD